MLKYNFKNHLTSHDIYAIFTADSVWKKGNLSLLSDNSQQIYTQLNGEKIFFRFSEGTAFTKALFSNLPWDYHSAEKEGDYIKVIAKAQNNRRRPAAYL